VTVPSASVQAGESFQESAGGLHVTEVERHGVFAEHRGRVPSVVRPANLAVEPSVHFAAEVRSEAPEGSSTFTRTGKAVSSVTLCGMLRRA
jgi:hypothetical protein